MPVVFEKHTFDDLASLKVGDLDKLPYGVIQLSRSGDILAYNAAEADLTGRDPKAIIGKNFFREVAPCTDRPEFRGRFEEVMKSADTMVSFEYTFDHQMAATRVKVQMKRHGSSDTCWVIVSRL